MHFVLQLVPGTSTNYGSGNWLFGLPVPAFGGAYWAAGSGFMNNPNRPLVWRATSATEVFVYETASNGVLGSGVTLSSGSVLLLSGTYDAT